MIDKEKDEFLGTLEAAFPHLSKTDIAALLELAVLWANRAMMASTGSST